MESRRADSIRKIQFKAVSFSLVSTVLFMMFQIMHISLAYGQYDTASMQQLSESVSKNLIPDIDLDKPLAPKQFTSRTDLVLYFLNDVNKRFSYASDMV